MFNSSLPRTIRPRSVRNTVLWAAAAGLALGGVALPAAALETLDPIPAASGGQDGECPTLTAVKYPWLQCEANEFGGVTLRLQGQPAPKECEWRLPDGQCAADEYEWGIVPSIVPNAR